MITILVVEDDPAMREGLRDNLRADGYEVEMAADGESGFRMLAGNTFSCAILDVMLPKMSGFDVLRRCRAQGVTTPVLMLTAKGEEIDKVLGFELGADDYLTKPFSLRELLARVKALLRRNEHREEIPRAVIGKLDVDFRSYTAVSGKKPVEMTPKEFDVLGYLYRNRNRTVTRDELLEQVWGYDESVTSRTVDNFILRLRQKIEENPSHPRIIITMHGAGYRLVL